jgi:hypothetical protein
MAAAYVALLLGLAPAPAPASYLDLAWGGDSQFLALAGMSVPDPAFGAAGLQASAALWSIGVAVGVAYERYPDGAGGILDGGVFDGTFQWRWGAFLGEEAFRWFDPHVDLGFLLGGARGDDGGSWFRGAGYLGAGLELPLMPPDGQHLCLSFQYRWSPTGVHVPDSAPDHLLLFGLGLRNLPG